MKTIIKSLLVVVAVAAVAGGATYAYFSDSVTVSGNTISAGTLDLRVDSNPLDTAYTWSNDFPSPLPAFSNLKPGDNLGHQIIDIKNMGNITGDASIRLQRTSSPDNELPANINVAISFDGDHDGTFGEEAGDKSYSFTLADFYANPNQLTLGRITGTSDDSVGNIASVKIEWSVPASAGNDIQGDSTTMNAIFGLEQIHS